MHVRRSYYVCLICTSKTLETVNRRCTYSMAGDIGGQNSKHERKKMLLEVKFGSDNVVGYNVICNSNEITCFLKHPTYKGPVANRSYM